MLIEYLMLAGILLLIGVELSLFFMLYFLRKEVKTLNVQLRDTAAMIFGKKEEQKEPLLSRIIGLVKK